MISDLERVSPEEHPLSVTSMVMVGTKSPSTGRTASRRRYLHFGELVDDDGDRKGVRDFAAS